MHINSNIYSPRCLCVLSNSSHKYILLWRQHCSNTYSSSLIMFIMRDLVSNKWYIEYLMTQWMVVACVVTPCMNQHMSAWYCRRVHGSLSSNEPIGSLLPMYGTIWLHTWRCNIKTYIDYRFMDANATSDLLFGQHS